MKSRHVLGYFSLLASGLITSAQATTIYVNDNFDGYANQAAFQAAWPAIGSSVTNPSALLVSDQSVSAPNSVRVAGTTLNNEYRNRRSFGDTEALVPGRKLIWSFDFYDTSSTAAPSRNFANLQDTTAPGSTNQLVSMGLNNTQANADSGGNYYMARILGFSPANGADPDGGPAHSGIPVAASQYFKLNDFGVGLRSTGWHNLKTVITTDDGLSTDYAFYVDNVLAELVSNVGAVASMRQYDNIAIGSGLSNASTQAYFDNMKLRTVPEPGSLVLVSLLGLAFFGKRSGR